MAVKQKKRRWSDEEKRSICFQTTATGVSVAQVARRYAMNANLIFKWLRDERYAPEPDTTIEEADPVFLPIEIEGANSPVPILPPVPSGRIEIELPDGCRISAEGGFDVDMLARLLKGLSS
ncbi:MAG: transposase [Alcanivorax sp.]|nr:transposase [Alcanivorax sp.]